MFRLWATIFASIGLSVGRPPGAGGPASMAGVPLPDPSLPPGTVAVRVVAGSFDAPVAGAEVSVTDQAGNIVAGPASTDERGRARLKVQGPGRNLVVRVAARGQRRESTPFDLPRTGGLRFLFDLSGPGADRVGAQTGDRKSRPGTGRRAPEHGRGMIRGPRETGVWIQLRVRSLEAGRAAVNLTYALDVGEAGLGRGVSWNLPEGFVPVEGHLPDWVERRGRTLRVVRAMSPGRHTMAVAGWLRYGEPSRLLTFRAPWPIRGVAVVARRYDGFRVEGPQVRRQDMGGSLVAFVAQGTGERSLAVLLTGLPVRDRRWAWLVLLAAALAGGGPIVWGARRRNGAGRKGAARSGDVP